MCVVGIVPLAGLSLRPFYGNVLKCAKDGWGWEMDDK